MILIDRRGFAATEDASIKDTPCTALNTLKFVDEVALVTRPNGGAIPEPRQHKGCVQGSKNLRTARMRDAGHKSQNAVGLGHCAADMSRKVQRGAKRYTQDWKGDPQSSRRRLQGSTWACSSFVVADAHSSTLLAADVEKVHVGPFEHRHEVLLYVGR